MPIVDEFASIREPWEVLPKWPVKDLRYLANMDAIPQYRRLGFALNHTGLLRSAYYGARLHSQNLRIQLRELEVQIGQVEALIRLVTPPSWPPLKAPVRPPTLHAAIAEVLESHGNAWMRISRVTTEIAERGLYRRRDGFAASRKDVRARIHRYRHLFHLDRQVVRLSRPRQPGDAPLKDQD
jgi:hypothetical protein